MEADPEENPGPSSLTIDDAMVPAETNGITARNKVTVVAERGNIEPSLGDTEPRDEFNTSPQDSVTSGQSQVENPDEQDTDPPPTLQSTVPDVVCTGNTDPRNCPDKLGRASKPSVITLNSQSSSEKGGKHGEPEAEVSSSGIQEMDNLGESSGQLMNQVQEPTRIQYVEKGQEVRVQPVDSEDRVHFPSHSVSIMSNVVQAVEPVEEGESLPTTGGVMSASIVPPPPSATLSQPSSAASQPSPGVITPAVSISTIQVPNLGVAQLPLMQLPVIRPSGMGQFQVIRPQGILSGVNRVITTSPCISPGEISPHSSMQSSPNPPQTKVISTSASPTIIPNMMMAGTSGSLLMGGSPAGQLVVGSMSGSKPGQLVVGGSSTVQLPVVIPNSSAAPISQGVQLPIVMGRPTPVTNQMLIQLPPSMLQLQQVTTVAGGQPGKMMKLGAPLQLIPSTVSFPATTITTRAVSITQPKVSPSSGIENNKTPSPMFIPSSKIAKSSIQILPNQPPPTTIAPPRKSIVLKNPGAAGAASSNPSFVTISSENVKPFTGKIVGKVPPGVLRFSNPGLKVNQLYLTKFDAQGKAAQNLGDEKNKDTTEDAQIQQIIAPNPSAVTVEDKIAGLADTPSDTTEQALEADNDDQEEIDDTEPMDIEGMEAQAVEDTGEEVVSVCRKLDLDSDPGTELSLECDEEFDDSFEKKEEEAGDDEDGSGEELKDEIEENGDNETNVDETEPERMENEEDEDAKENGQEVNQEDIEEKEDSEEEEVVEEPSSRSEGGIETVDLLKPLPGHVPGEETVHVKTNEFGMIEVEDLGLGLVKKDVKTEDALKPPNVLHASPRKESMTRRIQDDEILYCEGCGCYGMAGEFVAQNSCSNTCNNIIMSRSKEKQKRERELKLLRMRRDEKKLSQGKVKRKGLPANATEEEINNWKSSQYNSSYPWQDPKKGFIWSKYLDYCGARAAPVRLFPGEPFPDPHGFREGMKLEAIDPLHQSLICVVTVAEVLGPRLRLHFDGYSDSHDFWENAESENLFPAGWCNKNNQRLTPPKGYGKTEFDWDTYLRQTNSIAAPDEMFSGRSRAAVGADSAVHGWKVGMKLEACDRQNKSLICVATVRNVMEGRVLLHFDGWELDYDYWTKPGSQNVKPVGWCAANKKQLNPPKGNHPSAFSWAEYLLKQSAKPVPAWAFRSPGSFRDESDFQEGMRLEAVDVYNPKLVRVTSVAAVEGRQLELHYDGWPDEMNHWVDDDHVDLHPCGWAAKTGHPLMAPLTFQEIKHWGERGGCESPGCRGVGHIKGARYTSHHSVSACPYAPQNLEVNNHIPDRLQGADRERGEESGQLGSQGKCGETLGRGSRRRKKRKFFDEEKCETDAASDGGTGSKQPYPEEPAGVSEERLRVGVERLADTSSVDNSCESGYKERGSRNTSRRSSTEKHSVKEEPDVKPDLEQLRIELPVKEEGVTVSVQTEPPSSTPSPPPFYTEWVEGVRRSVWQPGYLPQPEPPGTLAANWSEHSKILLGGRADSNLLTYNKAKYWDINQVIEFLNGIPNLEYSVLEEIVRDHEIDGESLMLLTQNDITQLMGVKLGPAIKIYNAIMAVRMRRE